MNKSYHQAKGIQQMNSSVKHMANHLQEKK